ncbi:MAG: SAM-dependent methyltransferase [Motiliproteus sp.]|jgi:SAM-dependent methyltransferase
MKCRHCHTPLQHPFLDLGSAPHSNGFLTEQQRQQPEPYFPLRLHVCDTCWLVQTEDFAAADQLFTQDYAYFSSFSSSWLKHAADYSAMITERLNLDQHSLVVELASNDGYLLKNFVAANIPCLGIEPTASTAAAAEALGVPVLREFFGEALGRQLAQEGKQADLIAGNNVIAHVPDINDFVRGMARLLKHDGVITLEFPHLLQLVQQCQFDTIYHEHFSYLSLGTLKRIFEAQDLCIFDVEQLSTHGGSLRIYGQHRSAMRPSTAAVASILDLETTAGMNSLQFYSGFQSSVDRIKKDLCQFLKQAKDDGKTVAAYGAAAKGNTLFNYCGIESDLIEYVVDQSPHKQGKYLPGSHIQIFSPEQIKATQPDYVVILPWNIQQEIMEQLSYITDWSGLFVTAIPSLTLKNALSIPETEEADRE